MIRSPFVYILADVVSANASYRHGPTLVIEFKEELQPTKQKFSMFYALSQTHQPLLIDMIILK